jgi:hypothetical protein
MQVSERKLCTKKKCFVLSRLTSYFNSIIMIHAQLPNVWFGVKEIKDAFEAGRTVYTGDCPALVAGVWQLQPGPARSTHHRVSK